jgi:uncharacterized protein YecE (DUF72 family)
VPLLHIGTSGWQHNTFSGRFYPDGIAQDDWLAHYAGTFDTVEVNNTFYQSPEVDALRAWRRRTPDGFRSCLADALWPATSWISRKKASSLTR